MTTKKINCIIDTDPGVDDAAAIALSLYDEVMDIKLITTVSGNRDIETVTRNTLHILEKFNREDIPVAVGANKAMERISPDASDVHRHEGLGGYIPPEEVNKKPIQLDAVEAMYETIKKYKNDISIIALGPHTNLGLLIKKHPDVVGMITHIYGEGCAIYGDKKQGERWMNYISFNASSDPEALKIVVESGIPVTMVPSKMGREGTNLTERETLKIRDLNDVGRFLFEMYSGYWEHGYTDRRIATNDTCAVLCLRFPHIFKLKKTNFIVNTTDKPGKTEIIYNKKGNINFVYKANKKKFYEYFYNAVKKLDSFKFYND